MYAVKVSGTEQLDAFHHTGDGGSLRWRKLQPGGVPGKDVTHERKPLFLRDLQFLLFRQQSEQEIAQIKNAYILLAQVKINIAGKFSVRKKKIAEVDVPVDRLYRKFAVYRRQSRIQRHRTPPWTRIASRHFPSSV